MSDPQLNFEPDGELEADGPPQNFADCPEPGIHRDVPFETYAGWRAVNSSVVKWGSISPKHFQAAFNGEVKNSETKDKLLGRAIHCRILEPETFGKRFMVAESCRGVFGSGPRKGQVCGSPGRTLDTSGIWFCGQHDKAAVPSDDGREIITDDERTRCEGVADSLHNLPDDLKLMLARPGWTECSITFDHKDLRFKGRLDRYAKGKRPCIIDLKKVQVGKGDRESCRKAILNYGYHIQAAIYCHGIKILEGVMPEFIWLFVEDNKPYDFNIIPADENDIAIGWEAVNLALRNYQESLPTPYGYVRSAEFISPGGLPAWYVSQKLEQRSGI